MKKLQLSEHLIRSLTELGLLESEAKIYAALVLLGYADVGDLIDALDVSKPRIYTSLGTLEEKGLIVQTSVRPVIYQAIEPNVALEMITKKYDGAKDEAIKQFKSAENQEIANKPSPLLCYIFGNKSFEFKIRDMIDNAKESVYCRMSGRYIKYLEKAAKKGIEIHLTVPSGDLVAKERAERLQNKGNVHINTMDLSAFGTSPKRSDELNKQVKDMVDLNNFLSLVVDDSEVLLVPPLKSDSISAINSTNKVLILVFKNSMAV